MATLDYTSQDSPAVRIRPGLSGRNPSSGTPGSPHTPLFARSTSSQFGSPGIFRTEEDLVVYEIGSRCLRAGFGGEASPRCILQFDNQSGRRVGDFRAFTDPASLPNDTADDWELWKLDVRETNLGLLEDKLERALREVHSRHLMLDLKSRKAVLAVPSHLPNALLETVLRVLFSGAHQPPSVILFTKPLLATVAAGLRSSLVIDIGWHETTVTAISEYREVLSRRTTRGGTTLSHETAVMLRRFLETGDSDASSPQHGPSFTATEDVMTRFTWCKSMSQTSSDGQRDKSRDATISIPGLSGQNVSVPFSNLAEPADKAFFDLSSEGDLGDDHNMAIHVLAWRCLLALPYDVRTLCMSRVIVTGGVSDLPGLKSRTLAEIADLVKARGWDPVLNYGSAPKPQRRHHIEETGLELVDGKDPPDVIPGSGGTTHELPASQQDQVNDDISEKIAGSSSRRQQAPVKAVVRGVETQGAWAGASLLANLRIDGSVEIKREEFLKSGFNSLPLHI